MTLNALVSRQNRPYAAQEFRSGEPCQVAAARMRNGATPLQAAQGDLAPNGEPGVQSKVVLPVPGPPVSKKTIDDTASWTACLCSPVSSTPIRRLAQPRGRCVEPRRGGGSAQVTEHGHLH